MEGSGDYYFEPEELNALFLSIQKAEREKKRKNLTFSSEYAKILSQPEKRTKPTKGI